jgi:sec-independent protein translocase protein TatC
MSDKPEKEMSFLDHLEELRWHLVRSAIAVMILMVVLFIYKDIVFDQIILAPKNPNFITYRLFCQLGNWINAADTLCFGNIPMKLISTNMSGQFTTHIWVSFIAALIVAFPYIFWEIWRFVKPGLYEKERKYTQGIVFYASFLFICGVGFGYFLIAPFSVSFLGGYQVSVEVQNAIDLNSYISTVTTLTLATGATFEMPILIYFLTKIGLVGSSFLRNYRKHAIVVILIIAAIITPPDVISQIIVTIPLMLLYEISILIAARVESRSVVN